MKRKKVTKPQSSKAFGQPVRPLDIGLITEGVPLDWEPGKVDVEILR